MKPLEGKLAALTGAAGGIGTRLAVRLREQGAAVLGLDRVPCAECDDAILADLSTEAGLGEAAEALSRRPIDLLINLAGVQHFGPFESQPPDSIRLAYAVNLIAPALLMRAVLPPMRARGAGHIVNIGSIMGSINYPYFAAYSSSKAGLKGLSEGLRRELAPDGILVTYIAPRAVATAFNRGAVDRFLALAKMKADAPDEVAARIVRAIVERRAELSIGVRESLFVRLNALLPGLIDTGLRGQAAKARTLFSGNQ